MFACYPKTQLWKFWKLLTFILMLNLLPLVYIELFATTSKAYQTHYTTRNKKAVSEMHTVNSKPRDMSGRRDCVPKAVDITLLGWPDGGSHLYSIYKRPGRARRDTWRSASLHPVGATGFNMISLLVRKTLFSLHFFVRLQFQWFESSLSTYIEHLQKKVAFKLLLVKRVFVFYFH